jgi:hypothetical protein
MQVSNHIHYLTFGGSSSIEVLQQSTLASVRLRICPSIKTMLSKHWRVTTGDQVVGVPQKIVATKIGANDINKRSREWLEQIKRHKSSGAQIYLDYTDHHLGFESIMSDFYRQVMVLVDKAITPSKGMQNALSNFYKKTIEIIEDPIEISIQAIKPINQPITILWFGHASNIEYLVQFLNSGFHLGDSIRLIILSNEVGLHMLSQVRIESPAKIECQTGIWSSELMLLAASKSDVCIIPSNPSDSRKSGASSNRLITALALGLPVAADHLDSYVEFSDFYADIRGAEFRKLLLDPASFHKQVDLAQKTVIPRFSMAKSEVAWAQALL